MAYSDIGAILIFGSILTWIYIGLCDKLPECLWWLMLPAYPLGFLSIPALILGIGLLGGEGGVYF